MTDLTTLFGPLKSAALPEKLILDLSRRWFLEYLAAFERENDYDPRYFPPLSSLVTANDFDGYWPEDALPCLLVMNSGLSDRPRRNGDGSYDVRWLYGCAIIVSTPTRQDTRDAMHAYAAAFSTMLMHHRSLEAPEHIDGVGWVDGRPVPMPQDGDRMLGCAQMFFTVDVRNVMSEQGTTPFAEPRENPYEEPADLGVVEEGKATATIVAKEDE